MQTWKLEIEYEGTRYSGWQIQPNHRTVQGEIVNAAQELFGSRVELGGSGRTDAGVHALRQIAHLKTENKKFPDIMPRQLQNALNDRLPHDINILRVQNADYSFHARHDAQMRFYLYQIATRRTAFGKNYVWWIKDRLHLGAMREAAQILVGRHDFASFCDIENERGSTIVQVAHSEFFLQGDLLLYRIGASHFLWKMVRRIVGALVQVGRGKMSRSDIENLLNSPSRQIAQYTAPPSGLFLEKVLYDGENAPNEKKAAIFTN